MRAQSWPSISHESSNCDQWERDLGVSLTPSVSNSAYALYRRVFHDCPHHIGSKLRPWHVTYWLAGLLQLWLQHHLCIQLWTGHGAEDWLNACFWAACCDHTNTMSYQPRHRCQPTFSCGSTTNGTTRVHNLFVQGEGGWRRVELARPLCGEVRCGAVR